MTISFTCAQCRAALKVDRDKAGRSGRCPRCGASIRVPEAPLLRGNNQSHGQGLPLLPHEPGDR